ncbi:hypothetical protein [Sphingomonas sp. 66-10]|jgi:YD repeat-containing protein|uniref:hypothetical protein n=1 Tax=Sphingomonas sp. 66-10 TaxID=1895848 RepID=UPI000A8C0EBD|nr:hypothetical protein [Sphingomonas sp. 66-10]
MTRSVARAILTSSALFAAATATSIARANETVKYTYDAKGRIVSIQHTGTINNNVVANYTYDTADNRTRVTLSGAPFGALSSSSPSNSCTLGANGLCTLTICWAITSGAPSNVVVKVGAPQAVFAASGAGGGCQDAPWIQASGSTFYLYADSALIATLYVHGTS